MAITPQRSIHYACYGVAGTVAAWTLASVFAIAFQCELPSPWMVEDGKCINTRALELFIGIVNIITDLSLIVIPAIMMGGVQTNISKKWQVMILFGCRILVPAFIIPQMIAYHTDVDLDDYSWTMVSPIIWTAIVMNLSILTACIPSLKGVLDMFKSGTSLFTIPTQYEAELGSSSKGVTSRIKTALSGRLGIGGTRNHSQTGASSASGEWPTRQMKKVQGGHHTSEVSSAGKEKSHLGNIPERSESQRSLTEGAILRTIDYEIVGYEDRGDSRTARGSDHSHSPAEPDDFIRATVK
ncbi:hypothetical protein B0A52_07910 [Exophiala mesophila]|uniref:Rhodopsin domain-containing protein n=1 Tax=Exophiala mesophila TaxID=212818 RepID=A0A438MZ75_EXOME|nr:hypothetical protein B0A52_07910 [Exophiala mesophila]